MTDFFISYNSADVKWAEWIGFALEDQGFTTIIQAWDFRPGSNFVLQMQHAATQAERTIMVLSPDYLTSQFAAPEWAAAFAQDPQGLNQKLVPVMVRDCKPPGLLPQIVQIRIIGLPEAAAREALLQGVDRKRAKPSSPPPFPGATVQPKAFPGPAGPSAAAPSPRAPSLIPALNCAPSDLEKRRFSKAAFEAIRAKFEMNLQQVAADEPRIETDFLPQTASEFRAELFLDEKSKCKCRIWQGGMHSENGISYSEGSATSGNGCNEILSVPQSGELVLQATMAMGGFQHEKAFDLKRLSPDEAADYLWQRFVRPLSY